jgi:hypothetical protein
LDADCRAFFVRLAVFVGRFDLEAAHQVCWPEDEFAVIHMLEDLVAKSLLIAQPTGDRTTYLMLETMRQYSWQRLPDTDRDQLTDQHARFFADLAERSWDGVRSDGSEAWLGRIDDNLDNIRAAFDNAFARQDTDRLVHIVGGLFMYNHTRRLPEIFAWLEQVIALPGIETQRLARHARLHQGYAYLMQNRLVASEAELRAVLDSSDDRTDPLVPLGLTLLSSAVGNQGRTAEMEALSTRALVAAEERGAHYDYERSEATWQLCCAALFAGAPDIERSREYLAFGRRIGYARAVSGGLIHCGCSDPDPERGMESLAEARELTARTGDSFRYGIATVWLGALRCFTDPVDALQMIPGIIEHARKSGLRLIVAAMRDYTVGFAAVGRHELVAVLDGATIKPSIRPAAAADAIAAARHKLGDARHEQVRDHAATLVAADVDELLVTAVSDLR